MDKLFRKMLTPNYYKLCDGKFDKNQFNKLLVYREEINRHLVNLEKQEIGVFQVIDDGPKKKKKRVYTKEEVKEFGATYYETNKERLLKQAKERHKRNRELKAKQKEIKEISNEPLEQEKEKEKVKEKEPLSNIQELQMTMIEMQKSFAIIADQFVKLAKSMEQIKTI